MNSPFGWLAGLRSSLTITDAGWSEWEALDAELTHLVRTDPTETDQRNRSQWLRSVRCNLATYTAPECTTNEVWQAGAQFLAGYHDLDLREATGTGHAQMILAHAPDALAQTWQQRLRVGALAGIAATESHGGSRIHEITTAATLTVDERWRINGEKCWVSRLEESEAFIVFTRDPVGSISAVYIDADAPGLARRVINPTGLGGWAWGLVTFTDVEVDPDKHLLGAVGDGLRIFTSHFERFRPLVTACALGKAAGVLNQVRSILSEKLDAGILPRIRDNALVELGEAWVQINAALLLVFHAADPGSGDLVSRLGKAHGVDTACRVVERLAPLVGAAGFQRHHPIAKARLDLMALQYADGIHDALYRSGGAALIRSARASIQTPGFWEKAS